MWSINLIEFDWLNWIDRFSVEFQALLLAIFQSLCESGIMFSIKNLSILDYKKNIVGIYSKYIQNNNIGIDIVVVVSTHYYLDYNRRKNFK